MVAFAYWFAGLVAVVVLGAYLFLELNPDFENIRRISRKSVFQIEPNFCTAAKEFVCLVLAQVELKQSISKDD